jgi:fibronectin-binding autotransporter adhesin
METRVHTSSFAGAGKIENALAAATQSWRRHRRAKAAIALAAASVVPWFSGSAYATNGTWTGQTSSSWTNTGNWTNGTVATGTGAIATFDAHGSGYTVTVVTESVGTLLFENASGSSFQNNVISGGTLTLAPSSGAATINISGSGNQGSNVTIASLLAGSGGFNFAGTAGNQGGGQLTLTGNNTGLSGNIAISSGTLDIKNANALGTSSGTITVSSGGTFQLDGSISVGAHPLTIGGAGDTVNSFGALESGSGSNTFAGLLTLSAATTIDSDTGSTLYLTNTGTITGPAHTITLTGAGNGSIASSIGTTTGGLTENGTGLWTLTASNLYSGGTSIGNGATLNIQNSNALGTGGVTVTSGGSLQLQGGISTGTNALSIGGVGDLGTTGALDNVSGNNTYAGLLTLTASTNVSSDSGTLYLTNGGTITATGSTKNLILAGAGNGSIASIVGIGTGQVIDNSAGVWTLSGANTYTGGTNLSAGTLSLGSSGALGTTGSIAFNGGTLQYSSSNTTDYSSRFSTTGTDAYSIDTNGQNVTFASALSDTNASVTKIGAGTLTLSHSNSYTGGAQINGGTLSISADNQLGNGGGISLDGGALNTTASFSTNRAIVLYEAAGNAINVASGTTLTASGSVISILGNGGLTTTGPGTLILSGSNNSYSGPTTISSGTLLVDGMHSGGGNYSIPSTIAASTTFGGTGIATLATGGTFNFAGASSSINAIVAPGDPSVGGGIGTLTLSAGNGGTAVTLGTNSVLAINVNGAATNTADLLSVTGTASLAGALNVTLGGTTTDLNSGTSLTVLNTSGGITGSFTNVAFGSRILSTDKSETFAVFENAGDTAVLLSDFLTPAKISITPVAANTNVHVGATTIGVNVGNTAAAGSDTLHFTLSGNLTNTGSVTAGAAAANETGSYTAVVAVNNLSVTATDPNASNNPQTATFTVTGYNLAAAASTSSVTINAHAGVAASTPLSLTNTAPVNATYTETLSSNGFSSTTSGFTYAGSVSGIVGGGSSAGTLAVGVGTTLAAGQTIGTTTLALNSNAVNGSGLGITALTPDLVTITANVYNLAAAATTSTVNIGAAHVGVAKTAALSLTNTAPTNATYTETLSSNGFSSTTSGFTYAGSVSGIAGGASSAGTLVVGLGTTLAAGPVSGTTTLALNSNAVNGSGLGITALTPDVVTITGTEYNLAAANTIGTLTLSTHQGVAATQALTLSNVAPTNATYSETLTSTGFGTPTTGFTATGSVTTPLIAGGASDSSDLIVGLGTGLAEGQTSGSVALNLASNAVNGSGLGITTLSPQTVNLVAKVYDLAAAASTSAVTVSAHAGYAGTTALALTNTAPTNATYTETLSSGAFSGTTSDFTTGGSVAGIAGGASSAGTLLVGVDNTLAAGQTVGTTTLALNSNAVNGSGLGTTAIGSDTVTITAKVYNLAAAANTSTVNIGAAHVGVAKTAALSLTNTAPVNATYTETLSSNGFSSTTSGFTYAGSVSGIAGGASSAGTLVVGLGTTLAAGPVSGTTTLALNSNAVNGSGLGITAIGSDTVTITGTEYNLAAASTPAAVAFGSVHQGGTVSQALSMTNTAASGIYSEGLDASIAGSGNVTASGSFNLLAAGSTDSTDLTVGLTTTTLGSINANATITLNSDGSGTSGLGTTTLTSKTVNVTGSIYSGLSTWNTFNSGSWGTLASGFGSDWGSNQGSPGLDPNFTTTDTATFGLEFENPTVSLNGASPSLKAVTFNSTNYFGTTAAYTIAPGTGGTLKLNGGSSAATVTDTSTSTQTISAPVELDSATNFVISSGDTLTISGVVSDLGSQLFDTTNTGTLTLSNASNTYNGATTISSGTLKLSATATNNIASSSAITVGSGATLNVSLTSSTIVLAAGSGGHTGGQVLGGAGTVTGSATIGSGAIISGGTSTALGTGAATTVGVLTTSSKDTFGSDGEYSVKINAATGTAGTNWDEIKMATLSVTATGADSDHEFYIAPVAALTGLTYGQTYTWVIGNVSSGGGTGSSGTALGSGVSGSAPNLLGSSVSAPFALDTSNFSATSTSGGYLAANSSQFTLELITGTGITGENIQLQYTATPEPGTTLLVAAGLIPMTFARRRRKTKSQQSGK